MMNTFTLVCLTILATASAASQLPDDQSVQVRSRSKFTGKSNFSYRNETTIKLMNPNVLEIYKRREPTAWRFKYIEEFLEQEKHLLVVEDSIDERLANIAYLSVTGRSNVDFVHFNSGSKETDEQNQLKFQGSKVEEKNCTNSLKQMASLIDELKVKLLLRRSNKVEQLDLEEKHIHLARVLESFGRYDSGYLSGKISSMGSFEQCQTSSLLLHDSHKEEKLEQMRFCWARHRIDKHLDAQLRSRKGTDFETKELVILSGICIPKSCHTQSFRKNRHLFEKIIKSQFKLPQDIYLDENLELKSIFCLPDDDSEFKRLPLSGRLLLVFLAFWLTCGLISTMYNMFFSSKTSEEPNQNSKSAWWIFLESLDFLESFRDFLDLNKKISNEKKLESSEQHQKVEFSNLSSFKVIGTTYVVMGHSILVLWNYVNNFVQASSLYFTERPLFVMLVGVFVVDSFFVISGILLCYGILKRMDTVSVKPEIDHKQLETNGKNQEDEDGKIMVAEEAATSGLSWNLKFCIKIISMRYLRLVPLYLLVFWFNRGLLIYLDTGGPYADYGLNRLTTYGACQYIDSWWTPFSFFSSLIPMTQLCIPQAWSISCDLFFTLIIVPICMLLSRKPICALSLIGLTCCWTTWLAWNAYLEADPMKKFEVTEAYAHGITYLLNDFSYLYTLPHYRMTTNMIGVLAGYLVYMERKFASEQLELEPKQTSACSKPSTKRSAILIIMKLLRHPIVTTLVIAVALQPYVGAYFMPEIRRTVSIEKRLYSFEQTNVLHRVVWAISNAIIFIRMITDWQTCSWVKFAGAKFWKILVKLDYAILLIHLDILHLSFWSPTHSRMFSTSRSVYDFFACYSITLPLATLMFVIFENPINKFTRQMFTSYT